jgi:hypothetical protein
VLQAGQCCSIAVRAKSAPGHILVVTSTAPFCRARAARLRTIVAAGAVGRDEATLTMMQRLMMSDGH